MMSINRNRTEFWKSDVEKSVDLYNRWFLEFAPDTYRRERELTAKSVRQAFKVLSDGMCLTASTLDQAFWIDEKSCGSWLAADSCRAHPRGR